MQPTRLLCPWDSPGKNTGVKKIKEHWSGLPCPPPGDLLNSVIKPRFLSLQLHYSFSWSLGSGFFPLTMDGTVALDCILSRCCTLCHHSTFRSWASKANNASSNKECPLMSPVSWLSSLLQLLLLPLVSMRYSLLSLGPFPSLKSSLRSILAVTVRCIYPQQGSAVKSSVDFYSHQVKRVDFSQRSTLNVILL